MRAALLALMLLFTVGPAFAVEPSEKLTDPVLEARARDISKELRCLVCQNQSIDDSDADLARDLRRLVRDRIVAGDNDAQVLDFIVERYGQFVLLRPPFEPVTWVLWLGPLALLLVGAGGIALVFRRRLPEKPQDLDLEEKSRLERLMSGN
ncbi:MAG TPA: cytochrome c-type biogenesis protein [Parvibaculum sp.]|jgi:cytochrome c-type biogenesis protein CcmH